MQTVGESQLLAPIAHSLVSDEIVKRLIGLIVETGLRPGDRLPSERHLQCKFTVGRSSMREAIKTLVAMGLVEVRSGSGMFVGRGEPTDLTRGLPWGLLLSDHSAREVVEARQVVEPELAALAAERATADELAAIATELEVMRAGTDDVERYIAANVAFHLSIAAAAHNRVLAHVFESLQYLVRIWTRRTCSHESIAEHAAVQAAIAAGDTEAARYAMVAHLRTARERTFETAAEAAGGMNGLEEVLTTR
ncbi:MAG: FadR/GntR family transcriptional regulator [Chloroflexota bacterium]